MSSSTYSRIVATFVGILLALAFFSPVHAESIRTIHVDPIDDNDPAAGCTLREAIDVANAGLGAGTAPNGCAVSESGSGFPVTYNIDLPSYVYTLSGLAGEDGNVGGDLDLFSNINIAGVDSGSTILDGGKIDRVLDVRTSGISVSISNVTVRNGRKFGGIQNNGATLTILSSTVTDNVNTGRGGGVFAVRGTTTIVDSVISANEASKGSDFGGVGVTGVGGTLTISDSLITRNKAGYVGGGIGGLGSQLIVNVSRSTISFNSALIGGGIFHAGAIGSALNILDSSTIDNDATSGQGGGIYIGGSGLDVNVANSVIASNSAGGRGGGIYLTSSGVKANLTNSTVVNNGASEGGFVYRDGGTLNLKNSIVANNQDTSGAGPDCLDSITSLGHNLLGKNTGCLSSFPAGQPNINNDYVGTGGLPLDPKLGTPRGEPVYYPLQIGSPAIDKIPAPPDCTFISSGTNPLFANGAAVVTDQPGTPRDSTCDIGAYEVPPLGIQVLSGGADVPDDTGRVGFGVTSVGIPVTKTFTVLNLGKSDNLSLSGLSTAPGVSIADGFSSSTVAPGNQAGFTIQYDAATAAAVSGPVSFGTNVPARNPFNFTVDGAAVQLELAKSASAGIVKPGQLLTYTVVFTAAGGANITNWVVSDTLPARLSLIHPVTLFPPLPGTTLAQTNGDLPTLARGVVITPSVSAVLVVPLQVSTDWDSDFSESLVLTNTATISSTEFVIPSSDTTAVELTWWSLHLPLLAR